jgi:hypothetical protein
VVVSAGGVSARSTPQATALPVNAAHRRSFAAKQACSDKGTVTFARVNIDKSGRTEQNLIAEQIERQLVDPRRKVDRH